MSNPEFTNSTKNFIISFSPSKLQITRKNDGHTSTLSLDQSENDKSPYILSNITVKVNGDEAVVYYKNIHCGKKQLS